MAKPVRVQLRRTKGWRMPENTVKVDRTTMFGNIYFPVFDPASKRWQVGWHWARNGIPHTSCGSKRAATLTAISMFRNDIETPGPHHARLIDPVPYVSDCIKYLRGRNLACWCALDAPCHADVLLELANG